MPLSEPLSKFAEANRLVYSDHSNLPQQGDLLSRAGKVEGAATGALPGGPQGTLAHFTYTYTYTDSDDHTHHQERPFTIVVTEIPESIGFMPYLGFSGSASKLSGVAGDLNEMRKLDLGDDRGLEGTSAYVFKGASENWTAQLFSPALVDWLARSDEGFGFELAAPRPTRRKTWTPKQRRSRRRWRRSRSGRPPTSPLPRPPSPATCGARPPSSGHSAERP